MKKTKEEKEEFYATCAELLGIEHDYHDPVPRRTRWNNRLLGNGRYPGFGLIRCFDSCVMVTDRRCGSRMYKTYDEVYEYLKSYMAV